MSALDDQDRELYQATGWLRAALEVDHPGYLEDQIEKAAGAGCDGVAAGLRRMAGLGEVSP